MTEYLQARAFRDDVIQLVLFRNGAEISVEIELDPDRKREHSRAELTRVVSEVMAARLMPSERPPPADEDLT
jgi:hypothetical protein